MEDYRSNQSQSLKIPLFEPKGLLETQNLVVGLCLHKRLLGIGSRMALNFSSLYFFEVSGVEFNDQKDYVQALYN